MFIPYSVLGGLRPPLGLQEVSSKAHLMTLGYFTEGFPSNVRGVPPFML